MVFGGESNILTKWKVEVGLEGEFWGAFPVLPLYFWCWFFFCTAFPNLGPCLVPQRTPLLLFSSKV